MREGIEINIEVTFWHIFYPNNAIRGVKMGFRSLIMTVPL